MKIQKPKNKFCFSTLIINHVITTEYYQIYLVTLTRCNFSAVHWGRPLSARVIISSVDHQLAITQDNLSLRITIWQERSAEIIRVKKAVTGTRTDGTSFSDRYTRRYANISRRHCDRPFFIRRGPTKSSVISLYTPAVHSIITFTIDAPVEHGCPIRCRTCSVGANDDRVYRPISSSPSTCQHIFSCYKYCVT